MKEIITVRDLAMVTSDIQGAQKRGAIQLVSSLIEIGGLLIEAKTMVEPKDWEKYIWDNFGYSTSTADNWMKLHREYGDDQASFFKKLQDSQTFGKLSYTKLLALTDIPAEERLEFAEQNHVEDMSTRELQKAIKERDEARKDLKDTDRKLDEAYKKQIVLEQEVESLKDAAVEKTERWSEALDTAKKETEQARAKAKKAEKDQIAAEKEVEKLKKQLSDVQSQAKKAAEDAKKAAQNPEIPEAMMEQLRAEAQAEAAKQAAEDLQKQLQSAQAAVDAANKAREEAERKLADRDKESTMANPDVIEFKAMIKQVREDFNRLQGMRKKIQLGDEATGKNLMQVTLQLLDKLREEVT